MDPLEQFKQMLLAGLALPQQAMTGIARKAMPVAEFLTPTAYQPQPMPNITEGMPPGKVGGGEQTEGQKLLQTGLENLGPGKVVGAAGTIGTLALLKKALQQSVEAAGTKAGLATAEQLAKLKNLGLTGDYSQFTAKAVDELLGSAEKNIYKKVPEGTNPNNIYGDKIKNPMGNLPTPEQLAASEDPTLAAVKQMLEDAHSAYDLEKKTKSANVTKAPGMNQSGTGWDWTTMRQVAEQSPEQAPLSFPWRAYLHGFNVPAYHGTASTADFSQFGFRPGDLGAHFGTPRAADERLIVRASGDAPLRVYPVLLKPGKSWKTGDTGQWGYDSIWDELMRQQEAGTLPKDLLSSPIEKEILQDNWGSMPAMRDYLTGKGYSSIKYTNQVEHPGSTSWIMFQPDPADPAYISGIKSPWAKFKDLRSSNILASLAALGLAGTEFSKKKEPLPEGM